MNRKTDNYILPSDAPVDLHLHSSYSDGSDGAEELVQRVIDAGIEIFALTDHDTADGVRPVEEAVRRAIEAADARKKADGIFEAPMLRFIRGIEFSCRTEAGKCHILGYDYDPDHPGFQAVIDEGVARRRRNLGIRLNYMKEHNGIEFTQEEIDYFYSLKTVGKPHMATVMVKKGICSSITEAIQKYLNGSNSVTERLSGESAVKGILAGGGIPVWAHPLGGEGEKRLTEEEFFAQLKVLMDCGIRGLECYYSRYSEEESAFLREQAEKHGLLISGGSDCHGTKKDIPAGALNRDGKTVRAGELTILEELFSQ